MSKAAKTKYPPIVIQWRSASQWKDLPSGDLKWTAFVTLTSRDKDGPVAQAAMILRLLNEDEKQAKHQQFEYRIKP